MCLQQGEERVRDVLGENRVERTELWLERQTTKTNASHIDNNDINQNEKTDNNNAKQYNEE